MTRIVVVQPYVPAYRKAFFEQVIFRMKSAGIDVCVWQVGASGDQVARRDGVDASWVTELGTPFSVGHRRLSLTKSLSFRDLTDVDALVLPLEGTSLDIPLALEFRRRNPQFKVLLWGHVKNYVSKGNRFDQALERFYMRRSDHVFAYVESGLQEAVRFGVSPTRVTSLNNTVETGGILAARTHTSAKALVDKYSLDAGCTFSYIGGLDASKRIDFFARVLDRLWSERPDIRFLVGGEGVMAPLLQTASGRGQVVMLGRVDDVLKGKMAVASKAIVMPGRIGLVAVDALAMGLPVLTTRWAYHAPEYDYLTEGRSVFQSEDSEHSFAQLITEVADTPLMRPVDAPPALGAMVDNFCAGLQLSLED